MGRLGMGGTWGVHSGTLPKQLPGPVLVAIMAAPPEQTVGGLVEAWAVAVGQIAELEGGVRLGGADTSGSGHGGPGGDAYARGGVKDTRRPFRALMGEKGTGGPGRSKERGIFIPGIMERPGNQGREKDVVRALLASLRKLRGPQIVREM